MGGYVSLSLFLSRPREARRVKPRSLAVAQERTRGRPSPGYRDVGTRGELHRVRVTAAGIWTLSKTSGGGRRVKGTTGG